MKTSTKVLIIVNVIALVVSAVLFPALTSIMSYQPAFTVSFSIQAIVALVFFALWLVTFFILFSKFLKRLSFPRKLFFVTVTYTSVFAVLVFGLLNIGSINYAPVNTFRAVAGINTNMTIVYVLIGVLTALFIVALSLTFRRLSRPIKKVNIILSQINSGVHKPGSYKLGTSKEFNMIASNLNALDQKLLEQEKMLKLANDEYEKVVPKQFLKHLGIKNFTGLTLGNNVEKQATTLFCDLRNKSQKLQNLTPAENFKLINDYLAILTPIVKKHGGFVDKYIGDGVLAVFAKSQNAVDCAKSIIREITIKNKQNAFPYELEVKMCINSSNVVFGVVGDQTRKSPTILSNELDLVTKMQEVNEIYGTKVLVSKSTLLTLKNNTNFRYIGVVKQNDGENFPIYECLDVLPLFELKKIIGYKNDFEKAVRLLEDKKYDSARKIFIEIQKGSKDDKPLNIFISRCEKIKK